VCACVCVCVRASTALHPQKTQLPDTNKRLWMSWLPPVVAITVTLWCQCRGDDEKHTCVAYLASVHRTLDLFMKRHSTVETYCRPYTWGLWPNF